MQHYVIKFVSDCDRSVVFSGYYGFLSHKSDRHDITEILMNLSTINQTKKNHSMSLINIY